MNKTQKSKPPCCSKWIPLCDGHKMISNFLDPEGYFSAILFKIMQIKLSQIFLGKSNICKRIVFVFPVYWDFLLRPWVYFLASPLSAVDDSPAGLEMTDSVRAFLRNVATVSTSVSAHMKKIIGLRLQHDAHVNVCFTEIWVPWLEVTLYSSVSFSYFYKFNFRNF